MQISEVGQNVIESFSMLTCITQSIYTIIDSIVSMSKVNKMDTKFEIAEIVKSVADGRATFDEQALFEQYSSEEFNEYLDYVVGL